MSVNVGDSSGTVSHIFWQLCECHYNFIIKYSFIIQCTRYTLILIIAVRLQNKVCSPCLTFWQILFFLSCILSEQKLYQLWTGTNVLRFMHPVMHQNLQTRDQHSSVVVCIRIKIRLVVIRDQLLDIYMLLHCVKCNMKFSIGKTSSTSENLQPILFGLHLTIKFAIGYQ